jgi:hypothetical protein
MQTSNTERPALEDLLPFYATGTLDAAETRQVEAALERDAELARRYGLVQDELAATVQLNESLGAPSAQAMQALFARIEAAPARQPKARFDLRAWLGERLSPRPLAWASAMAAVILLQAAVLGGLYLTQKHTNGTFETASYQDGMNTAAKPAGTFAIVGFAPDATVGQISQMLEARRAVIIGGPRAGGLYTVRLSNEVMPAAERDRAIAALRSETAAVRFIGPAD